MGRNDYGPLEMLRLPRLISTLLVVLAFQGCRTGTSSTFYRFIASDLTVYTAAIGRDSPGVQASSSWWAVYITLDWCKAHFPATVVIALLSLLAGGRSTVLHVN